MTCQAKHTKYQPTEAEFKCPACGIAAPEGLCIDEVYAEGADPECGDLHPSDYLRCYNPGCSYDTNGQAFVNQLIKKKNLVPCLCCKGKGFVPAKKGKKS
jgi:hypothetical protein